MAQNQNPNRPNPSSSTSLTTGSGDRGQPTRGGTSSGRSLARGGAGALGRAGGSPVSLMRRMIEDMDRVLEGFRGGDLSMPMGLAGLERMMDWTPAIEVAERGDQLLVRADLPGMKKDDVHVELRDGMLVIEGERTASTEDSREGFFLTERTYGSFRRAVQLPEGIDESSVKADFHDGVLEISMKRAAGREHGRRIEVSSGDAGGMKH